LGIIDILDSFERVEESLSEKGQDKSEDAIKTINRYRTIQKKLINFLNKYGISKIEFPDNRLIVGLCEVVETEPDSYRKNDDIVSIVRSGYIRGKELIRAAQIIVVKN
jgi:molecular chaperone GrpE (heat shock protein)